MGNSAKVALVALLILMVVAVAQFVQRGKDEGTGPEGAASLKSEPAPPGERKEGSSLPRLVNPRTQAPGTRPVISSRGTTLAPSGAPGKPVGSTASPAGPPPFASTTGTPSSGGASPAVASAGGTPGGPRASPFPEAVKAQREEAPASSPGAPAAPVPFPAPQPITSSGLAGPAQGASSTGTVSAALTPPRLDPPPAAPAVALGTPAATTSRDPVPSRSGPSSEGSAVQEAPEVRSPFAAVRPPAPSAAGPSGSRAEPEPPASRRTYPLTHKVEAGESYWRIAEKYYGAGQGRLHGAISAANGGAKLVAGKTIKIPAPPAEGAESSPGEAPRAAPRPGGGIVGSDSQYDYYLVQRGDTLSGLAQRFYQSASKVAAIESANPSLRYETLREGMRIRIPRK